MDDQKFFAQVARVNGELITRVKHPERIVEVYNLRTQAWERTPLGTAAARVFLEETRRVAFTHAGQTRLVTLSFGRLACRLPETQQALWVLVVHSPARDHDLLLITNVPLTSRRLMRQVYEDWRLRSRIDTRRSLRPRTGTGSGRPAGANPRTHAAFVCLGLARGAVRLLHQWHLVA